jgi:hypothetical protein
VVRFSDELDAILARPEIYPLLDGIEVGMGDEAQCAFIVVDYRRAAISPSAFAPGCDTVVAVRHAIELCLQLRFSPDDPVLAGLMAARCAALFKSITFPPPLDDFPPWHEAMVGASPPSVARMQDIWPSLAKHQPGAPSSASADTCTRLATLWPVTGPTGYLITTGGDARLQVDPDTGLNTYGCSPQPRPWAITFASSTASSISERGYAAAEQARRRVLDEVVNGRVDPHHIGEAERIGQAIRQYYGVAEQVRVFIVPSGTDGELLALGIALAADSSRPLTNLLVGPDESGSGVPLAAAGRHFSAQTARGATVIKGELIDGVPADLELQSVPVRDAHGQIRPATEIMRDCAEKTAGAIAHGRRVLFHILDQSKTGLLAPILAGRIWPDHRDNIDLIVDASQARLGKTSVRCYIEHEAMVLVTGSKFFTGPPFAGALLVPPSFAPRLEDDNAWPAGFNAYFDDVGIGLALRWHAALAEMEAFAAVDEAATVRIIRRVVGRVKDAVKANADLFWHDGFPLNRPGFPESWDRLPTIFTFSVRQPPERGDPRPLFGVAEARQIYVWLNSDLSAILPDGCSDGERRLAGRYVHIGQPVALANDSGVASGAFRFSIGARLVSGEPSHRHLDEDARIDHEIDDALAALEKISLIVRYFEHIRAANPAARVR